MYAGSRVMGLECPRPGHHRSFRFRREGVRRDAELYPDGWQDLTLMGLLRPEFTAEAELAAADH